MYIPNRLTIIKVFITTRKIKNQLNKKLLKSVLLSMIAILILVETPVLFAEENDKLDIDFVGTTFDGKKYIRTLVDQREELYDLTRDSEERTSVLVLHPDAVERAQTILREYHEKSRDMRELHGIVEDEKLKFDQETARQLRSLGYIQ